MSSIPSAQASCSNQINPLIEFKNTANRFSKDTQGTINVSPTNNISGITGLFSALKSNNARGIIKSLGEVVEIDGSLGTLRYPNLLWSIARTFLRIFNDKVNFIPSSDNYTLILGSTKSGKSTFVGYQLGEPLKLDKAPKDAYHNVLLYSTPKADPRPLIGHDYKSTTKGYQVFKTFIDTAGSQDNEGLEAQISNAMTIPMLWKLFFPRRIVLVTSPHNLEGARLGREIHRLSSILTNPTDPKILSSILILVNDRTRRVDQSDKACIDSVHCIFKHQIAILIHGIVLHTHGLQPRISELELKEKIASMLQVPFTAPSRSSDIDDELEVEEESFKPEKSAEIKRRESEELEIQFANFFNDIQKRYSGIITEIKMLKGLLEHSKIIAANFLDDHMRGKIQEWIANNGSLNAESLNYHSDALYRDDIPLQRYKTYQNSPVKVFNTVSEIISKYISDYLENPKEMPPEDTTFEKEKISVYQDFYKLLLMAKEHLEGL